MGDFSRTAVPGQLLRALGVVVAELEDAEHAGLEAGGGGKVQGHPYAVEREAYGPGSRQGTRYTVYL